MGQMSKSVFIHLIHFCEIPEKQLIFVGSYYITIVGSYETEDFQMTNIVAILVKKASLEFDKIANPYFAEYDLTASQYRIIKCLYAQPSRTTRVVDLERQYSMTHPTTIGLLDALEKKGFTTRVENPNDARGKLIALTEKADTMQDELEALGTKIENKLTERLSDEEREQLAFLLNKLMGPVRK